MENFKEQAIFVLLIIAGGILGAVFTIVYITQLNPGFNQNTLECNPQRGCLQVYSPPNQCPEITPEEIIIDEYSIRQSFVTEFKKFLDQLESLHPVTTIDVRTEQDGSGVKIKASRPLKIIQLDHCETFSMRPTLDCNDDLIVYTPMSDDELNPGDIITFESHERLFGTRLRTHRIIEKRQDHIGKYYITHGDAAGVTFTQQNLKLNFTTMQVEYTPDNNKIRLDDIKYKIIAITYSK